MTVSIIPNTVSNVLFANLDVTAPLNFEAAAPQMVNLPEDLLDIDQGVALATVAALCSNPEVHSLTRRFNDNATLSLRLLALYGAGACIRLSRPQLNALLAEARRSSAPADVLSFVTNAAKARAVDDGVFGEKPERIEGLAVVSIDNGRGFGTLDSGLPASFHDQREFEPSQQDQHARYIRRRLLTYAALFSAVRRKRCNRHAEAVVMLALYGAGVRVSLTRQQFRRLERRTVDYIGMMGGAHVGGRSNGLMARFVLKRAKARAKWSGLI